MDQAEKQFCNIPEHKDILPRKSRHVFSEFTIDDLKKRIVIGEGARERYVHLSYQEYTLLFFLAKNKNMVISREQLLDHIWGHRPVEVETRIIDVYIGYIRRKLNIKSLKTVNGFGYMFEDNLS